MWVFVVFLALGLLIFPTGLQAVCFVTLYYGAPSTLFMRIAPLIFSLHQMLQLGFPDFGLRLVGWSQGFRLWGIFCFLLGLLGLLVFFCLLLDLFGVLFCFSSHYCRSVAAFFYVDRLTVFYCEVCNILFFQFFICAGSLFVSFGGLRQGGVAFCFIYRLC